MEAWRSRRCSSIGRCPALHNGGWEAAFRLVSFLLLRPVLHTVYTTSEKRKAVTKRALRPVTATARALQHARATNSNFESFSILTSYGQ